MEQMGQDKISINEKLKCVKNKIIEYYKNHNNKPLFILNIIMIVIFIIIIILLIQFIFKNDINTELDYNNKNKIELMQNDTEGDEFIKCENDRVYNFVSDFFKAKKYLDFVNIYRSFNKDYITMMKTDEGKLYENGILYEHNLVKDYINLEVYKTNGKKANEYVIVCRYDIVTYYTEEVAPTIIVAYIIDNENSIYFKDNLDIGESKYITKVLEKKKIKDMYNEVKKNLYRNLANDSNLKLVYNSLRQYDMNPNNYLLNDKIEIMDRLFGGAYNKEKEYMDLAREKMQENENDISEVEGNSDAD